MPTNGRAGTAGARVDLLGAVRLTVDGREAPLGSPQQRAVFAVLALHDGRLVPLDELVTALWGDDPPPSAATTVRTYLSRLRAVLAALPGAPSVVAAGGGAYGLDLDGAAVDVARLRDLVARATAARADGDLAEAGRLLATAVDLGRGQPLAGLPGPAVEAQRVRLDQLHDAAVEELLAVNIERGMLDGPIADLAVLVHEHPLRERLWELRMLALWHAGRSADALETYQEARRVLDDELAVEPGPALRALQQRILAGDGAGLAPAAAADAAPGAERTVVGTVRVAPGTRAHPQATAADREPDADRPPGGRPEQLPLAPRGFVGRTDELAWFDDAVADPSAAAVLVATGLAGVGKTSLVVHWARSASARFEDGVLFANLRGFDPSRSPTAPESVARRFVEALGVLPGAVPQDADGTFALYRTLTSTRRLLIVLDNAYDAEQVRPLLPGAGRTVVVVTSRSPLHGLVATHGARSLVVPLFTDDDARRLLAERLGSARAGEEPAAVDELVARAGGLPLALAILAARGAQHPGVRLADVVDDLALRAPGLDAYAGADPATDIRAVLSWSARDLDESSARMLRAVALHPGRLISRAGAASAAGLDLSATESALRRLLDRQLLVEPRPGLYLQHDLVRAYALELTDDAERHAVLTRVLQHYAASAERAVEQLAPQRARADIPDHPGVIPCELDSTAGAVGWFRAERHNFLPVLRAGYDAGLDDEIRRLARALQTPQDLQGAWGELIATQEIALAAARRQGDAPGVISTEHALGRGHGRVGHGEQAAAHFSRAIELARDAGDTDRLARALVGLATIIRDHTEIDLLLLEAVELAQSTGNTVSEAVALNNLAWHRAQLPGREAEALPLLHRARQGFAAVADRRDEAIVQMNYAWVLLVLRRPGANDDFRAAAQTFAELDDRHNQATALLGLGTNLWRAGEPAAGEDVWRQAWALLPPEPGTDPEELSLRNRLAALMAAPELAWEDFLPE